MAAAKKLLDDSDKLRKLRVELYLLKQEFTKYKDDHANELIEKIEECDILKEKISNWKEEKKGKKSRLAKEKDKKLAQMEEELKMLRKENEEMNLLIRIPRMHREFLEVQGALDNFVEAKINMNEE